jgi:hypothetical protein
MINNRFTVGIERISHGGHLMEVPAIRVSDRLPLADAALTLWRWAVETDYLDRIFEEHRGRNYEKVLSFPAIVSLIRDALLEYGGSGRRSFDEAKRRGDLEISYRAAHGKLGRIPIPLSRGVGLVGKPAATGASVVRASDHSGPAG